MRSMVVHKIEKKYDCMLLTYARPMRSSGDCEEMKNSELIQNGLCAAYAPLGGFAQKVKNDKCLCAAYALYGGSTHEINYAKF